MIKLIKRWIDKWKHKRKMKKRIEQLEAQILEDDHK